MFLNTKVAKGTKESMPSACSWCREQFLFVIFVPSVPSSSVHSSNGRRRMASAQPIKEGSQNDPVEEVSPCEGNYVTAAYTRHSTDSEEPLLTLRVRIRTHVRHDRRAPPRSTTPVQRRAPRKAAAAV